MPGEYKEIGERLVQLREALGFTEQRAFYEHLGIIKPKGRQTRVSMWERGDSQPSPQQVRKMKEEFGVTADWIYYGDRRGLTLELRTKLPTPQTTSSSPA